MKSFKFGHLTAEGADVEYHYPDVYDWERTTGPARLIIAPRTGHLELLRELAACWKEPSWVLYVLAIPRGAGEGGRYQCPEPLDPPALQAFLAEHREFLEGDGRHSLWVASIAGEGTVVYDRHNVLYAYGPLEAFEDILTKRGLRRAPVEFPVPHSHHYHNHHDASEARLLQAANWIYSPLRPGDED